MALHVPLPAPQDAPPGADPDELLALAERLAAEAGALVLDGRRHAGLGVAAGTKSTATDMVTEFDVAAERLIVEGLRAARPGDAVVGEEGTSDPGETDAAISWFVDPIDGTTNFLYGLAPYAVSVAAADAHGTLVAAVAIPPWGETFTAVRGRGARLNGQPVAVRRGATLPTALVATGFGYGAERRRAQAALWARAIGEVRDLRRFGAAAVDLCLVACGRVDAYAEHGLAPWDIAAGALVAVEAGAHLGAIEGGPVRPASVLAASPEVFAALQALLVGAGAADVAALVDGT